MGEGLGERAENTAKLPVFPSPNAARLFASLAFHALREDIAERLDADVLSGLAAA